MFSKTVDAYDLVRKLLSLMSKTAPPKIYGLCVINTGTQQYEYRSCQQNINVHILIVRKQISRMIEHQKTRTQNSNAAAGDVQIPAGINISSIKHLVCPYLQARLYDKNQAVYARLRYVYAHLPKICSSICSLKKSILLCPKRPNMLKTMRALWAYEPND